MRPYQAYQQQRVAALTRIDTILGLYDQAIDKIQQAESALAANDPERAQVLTNKAQLALAGLVCGNQGHTGEVALNFLRLYAFASRELAHPTLAGLAAAKQVLQTLREGFEAVRPEALRLEREGIIPPLDRPHPLEAVR